MSSTLIKALVLPATAASLLLLAAPTAQAASPDCSGAGENLISWPSVDPVWELCWVRPSESSGPSGSGLELRDVHYNGHLVFKRAHAPILNVDYDAGGCGCFRDWSHSERPYGTENQVSTAFFEPSTPPQTVCDMATGVTPPGDCPWGTGRACNSGVSAEYLKDRLRMTTQMSAGWYRYTMRWSFFLDGRIQPQFGFGTYSTACASASHRHHNYWRFDFDIDDSVDDQVIANGTPLTTEASASWTSGKYNWTVQDSSSGRGYVIEPGGHDLKLPADTFSKLDYMAAVYDPAQLGDTGGGCDINDNTIVNGESLVGEDIVVWYRAGVHDVLDLANPGDPNLNNIQVCKTGGPTLRPIGDWTPPSADIFIDDFETGGLSLWTATVP